jgi:hypothetical protein
VNQKAPETEEHDVVGQLSLLCHSIALQPWASYWALSASVSSSGDGMSYTNLLGCCEDVMNTQV